MPNQDPLPPDRPMADDAHSLAGIPDPAGPPMPVDDAEQRAAFSPGQLMGALAAAAFGGVAFTVLFVVARPCCGATQSAQLQWQERQAKVDRIVDEQLAQQPDRIATDD